MPDPSTTSTPQRLAVSKTPKMFVGGAFVRAESGRTVAIPTGQGVVEVPEASRKDARDAVRLGAAANSGWAGRDPYNRGQILYRIAEMLEERTAEFVDECAGAGLLDAAAAQADIAAAVDTFVHYAGWTDKLGQVLGTTNDVSGNFTSHTRPTGTGLTAVIANDHLTPSQLADAVGASLAAGNAVIIVTCGPAAVVALAMAEIFPVADVPSGVIQILSSTAKECAATFAAASDVRALDVVGVPERWAELEALAAETLTRVRPPLVSVTDPAQVSLARIRWQTERQTIWHPTGK